MREKIEPLLDDLKIAKRIAFKRELAKLPTNDVFQDSVSQEAKDGAIRALESSASELISEAVFRVLPISRAPLAFAEIEQAMHSFLSDSSQTLEAWYQQKTRRPSAPIVDAGWTDEMRRRLERRMDNYRSEFTIALADAPIRQSASGRKPKYDWIAATNAVWGKLYRGDLKPERDGQAVIENAFLEHFAMTGEEPGESTVRPYAKRLYEEVMREA